MEYEVKLGTINNVVVHDVNHQTLSDKEISKIKDLVYEHKILIIKNQKLDYAGYLKLGELFGTAEPYYEPMYHHPEDSKVFVSSTICQENGDKTMGVPKTGKFWHTDYAFMEIPFALTMVYPRVLPKTNRGTYFVDMGKVFKKLPVAIKERILGGVGSHSPRRYFKVRPTDVYRPLCEILREIEEKTPSVEHPCVITHPITGEKILYITEAFTEVLKTSEGVTVESDVLQTLLTESGQNDPAFKHEAIHLQTYEENDIVLWDNRSLIHCALHTKNIEPTESYRITLHDDEPFYVGCSQYIERG